MDVARFEFDFDTTWAGFFTDSKLRIYSRYGGRDEHEPEARLSKASLLQTMRESLAAHHAAQFPSSEPRAVPLWHPEPK
ncbi:MAG: thioredoxin family protein, partial [Planctomycetaceae bacterium]